MVLLLQQTDSSLVASVVLDKIRAALAEPVPIDGQSFHVTCSIGLATYPMMGQTPKRC